jgi:hypothetical protein
MFKARWWMGGIAVLALVSGLIVSGWAADKPAETAPKIQVALLLDTSNSMDGLIDQARTQLWKIVSEFTALRLGGKVPKLEVALYEYGNDGLPAQEGFIRLVVPLTGDLDKVSEALFALKTNGGSEFCGRVIDCATRHLTWSTSHKDIKCIFIAGNEPFTQGDVDYRTACKAAATKGITVNTIFCGPLDEGVRTNWQDGARLADGQFMSIDQNRQVAAAPAPQDKELAQLGAQLNQTYLAYGDAKKRAEALQRQVAQDANAAKSVAGVAAARVVVKASTMYRNTDWDLIDALAEGKVKLESLKDVELPEAIRPLAPAARREYVAKVAAERKQIQAKIVKLNEARKVFLAEQEKKLQVQAAAMAGGGRAGTAAAARMAAPAAPAFERAVIDAVKAEAAKR